MLFDSLGRNPSIYLKKQIAQIAGNKSTNALQIHTQSVQRQRPASNDCGVLAIAFAVSLAVGANDPTDVTYCEKRLRHHLRDCLIRRHFTEFPLLRTKFTTDRIQISTANIYSN